MCAGFVADGDCVAACEGECDGAAACGGFRDCGSGEHVGERLCCLVGRCSWCWRRRSWCFLLFLFVVGFVLVVVYRAQPVRVYTCGRFGVGVSRHVKRERCRRVRG